MSETNKKLELGNEASESKRKLEEEERSRMMRSEDSILTSAQNLGLRLGPYKTNHDDWELRREFWVRAHPALRKANDDIARAEHEAQLITGILAELFEEQYPRALPVGPHEGMKKIDVDKLEEKHGEDLVRLREALKSYAVSVPKPVVSGQEPEQ